MGGEENRDLVQQLQQAARDRDFDRYGLMADDAVWCMAGVQAGMGGVTAGRVAIVDLVRRNTGGGGSVITQQFGDDERVCVVGDVTADRFTGSQYPRSDDRMFATCECIVYRIADGKIAESTASVNWLDPHIQVGRLIRAR